jgi:glutaminyl-peptide cyclotransferase
MVSPKNTFAIFVFIFFLIIPACKNGVSNTDSQGTAGNNETQPLNSETLELVFETIQTSKKEYVVGEFPVIKIGSKNDEPYDSIHLYFLKKRIAEIKTLPFEVKIVEKVEKTGHTDIEAFIYKDSALTKQKYSVVFISDIEPKIYGYDIVKVYPHSRRSFTQGLVYEDGYFYESNGSGSNRGIDDISTLLKVQAGTGEPIQALNMSKEIFAEGLTIMGDKLYQLSWQNRVGFVYDKKTFQLISRFNYPTEGWGLTNDGKNLIMSDGTNKLYFKEPQSFTEIGRIEVYDNKGPVNELNELEYIDGEIYANVYRTFKIARIDPKTGKVLAYIDLTKILPNNDYLQDTDVLNGIAYDFAGKRLFVTGKRWPKLFEIKLK